VNLSYRITWWHSFDNVMTRTFGIGTSISSTETELLLPLVRDLLELDNGTFSTACGITMLPLPALLELGGNTCYACNVQVKPSWHCSLEFGSATWYACNVQVKPSWHDLLEFGSATWYASSFNVVPPRLHLLELASYRLLYMKWSYHHYPFLWTRRSQYAAMTRFVKPPCEKMYPSLKRRY
jgi:hypothetical protein